MGPRLLCRGWLTVSKNFEQEGTVARLSKKGFGVVRVHNSEVHVPRALPGEIVRFSIPRTTARSKKKGGKLLSVQTSSADRVDPVCQHAGQCGGCPLMHYSLSAQRDWKRSRLEKFLAQPADAFCLGEGLGYRRRARFSFSTRGGSTHLGYFALASNHIVCVEGCPILDKGLQEVALGFNKDLRALLNGAGDLQYSLAGKRVVLFVSTCDAQRPELYAFFERSVVTRRLHGIQMRVGESVAAWGDPNSLWESVLRPPIRPQPGAFSQANDAINDKLIATVLSYADAKDQHVLELFAGAGNLTLAMLDTARSITAVELDKRGYESLLAALAEHPQRQKVRVAQAPAASLGEETKKNGRHKYDVVVVDPPRIGLGDALVPLVSKKIPRMVYVSCDPESLARDLRKLSATGYQLVQYTALDMFPHTPHVETIALLEY